MDFKFVVLFHVGTFVDWTIWDEGRCLRILYCSKREDPHGTFEHDLRHTNYPNADAVGTTYLGKRYCTSETLMFSLASIPFKQSVRTFRFGLKYKCYE